MVEVTKKIHIEQEIKNYRELCKLLDEPTKTGKSKQLQLKEWERFFKWHKNGNKIIIDEVLDKPLEKKDNRQINGQNLSKYNALMDDLILHILQEDSYICEGKGIIFNNYLELYTDDYDYMYKDKNDFCEKYNISSGLANTYLDKMYMILEKCFETALNRLKKQKKITWRKTYRVLENPDLDFIADDEELKRFEKIFTDTYEVLDMKPIERKNLQKNDKFKNKACKLFNDKYTARDIFNFWKVYEIEINEKVEVDYSVDDNINNTLKELQIRLAQSICDAVQNHSMIIDNKKIKVYGFIKYIDQLRKLNELIFSIKPRELHIQSLQEKEMLKAFDFKEEEIEIKEALPF